VEGGLVLNAQGVRKRGKRVAYFTSGDGHIERRATGKGADNVRGEGVVGVPS